MSGLSKTIGGKSLLNGISFVVNVRECIGLIGPNGCGKSTLLDIIAGEDTADSGSVEVAPVPLGYVRQGYVDFAARRAGDSFPAAFAATAAEVSLELLAHGIATETDPGRAAQLANDYATLLETVSSTRAAGEARQLWSELGLRAISPDTLVGSLSGGEQTKLALIDVALSRPGALLLDEPTNNLDAPAIQWLDQFLARFAGPVLLVSHDRALLDDHADRVVEIVQPGGTLETYVGNYCDYAEEKARRHEDLWRRHRQQQRREERLQQEMRRIRARAQRTETRTINDFYRRKAKKVARRARALEHRLERQLESADHVERPVDARYQVRAEIQPQRRSGERMLVLEGLAVGLGGSVFLRDVRLEIGWGDRLVILGPNGSGKTTLLRTLLGQLSPLDGRFHVSDSVIVGYLPQYEAPGESTNQESPVESIRAQVPLSETESRHFLHRFLFSGDTALTPCSRLSYGERRRLALARLVLSGANLLLLDEPTNHLDIPSLEAFEAALEGYPGAMLAVTHDRYFIDRFAHRLLVVDDGRLQEVWATGG